MFRLNHLARICLLVASTCALTGCAFEREWQAAQSYAWPENELAGCWEGKWHSNWNGHNGGLRAIITKQGDNYYHAQFHATYLKVVPFEFELPMLVTDDGQIYTFEGDADLGLLAGGKYVYNGTAHDGQFNAEYSAENSDHGIFTMCKVKTCGDCGACGATEDSCGACSSRAECNRDVDSAEGE